jgi:hypothetical protein
MEEMIREEEVEADEKQTRRKTLNAVQVTIDVI